MIPSFLYDSFTRTPYAGNPAGVFLDADGLSVEQMLKMAAEISLESAFAFHDADGLALRYFTPTTEVPLCGHATIAAFTALAGAGRVSPGAPIPFTCPAGRLSARIDGDPEGVMVHLTQAAPSFGATVRPEDVVDVMVALGAGPNSLHPQLPIQTVSTGTPWMLVPVADRAVVDSAPGDLALLSRLSRAYDVAGIYVFTLDMRAYGSAEPMVHARCFAPAAGLDEDPVTGSASGALGCYLAHYGAVGPDAPTLIAEQGAAIGRAGRVRITPSFGPDGSPSGVEIAGVATLIAEGHMAVPPA